ncbi:hypothetical protein psyc5s11_29050 [Clostridium gelidum]|uniref:Uncharacterized protein n=1 Tax=Clostridium gelidum TaxID=704125 RepID=A0ABM7T781_9CLOT|nr:hypothetical protein psyc5s11_29050 [Clostridium gelidum]
MTCKCIKEGNTKSNCSLDTKKRTCDLAYNIKICRYDKSTECEGDDTCIFDNLSNSYTRNCKSVYILERSKIFYCCHLDTFPSNFNSKIEKMFQYDKGKDMFADITSTDHGKTTIPWINKFHPWR